MILEEKNKQKKLEQMFFKREYERGQTSLGIGKGKIKTTHPPELLK